MTTTNPNTITITPYLIERFKMIASAIISEVETTKIQAYLIIAIGVLTVLTAFLKSISNDKTLHNQSFLQRIVFEGEFVWILVIGAATSCFGVELLRHNRQDKDMSVFVLLAEYLKGMNAIIVAVTFIFVPLLTTYIKSLSQRNRHPS